MSGGGRPFRRPSRQSSRRNPHRDAQPTAQQSPQRWGFHALDDGWARRIVALSGVRPNDLVVDLGAGDGALTAPLLAAGASVIAVELHPRRAERLRERFPGQDLVVVCCDLQVFRWPKRPFSVVANPPYALTVAVVRALLVQHRRLRQADLVLQRRMVRHLLDRPPKAGEWWRDLEMSRGVSVPRRAFRPAPRVDSAVLQIRRR